MYKSIFIIIIIIIIVFTLNYITKSYTNNAITILNKKFEQIRSNFLEEELEEEKIKKNIDECFKEWYKRYEILAYYLEHDELEKVGNNLTTIKSCIDSKKYEDGIQYIDTCIFLLKHIQEKERINFKNVF